VMWQAGRTRTSRLSTPSHMRGRWRTGWVRRPGGAAPLPDSGLYHRGGGDGLTHPVDAGGPRVATRRRQSSPRLHETSVSGPRTT
jgi:hypothetical protein